MQVERLNQFLAEQQKREAQRRQRQATGRREIGIQCDKGNPAVKTADATVQTDFEDVTDELRKQVQDLKQVVAELTALKNQLRVSGQTSDPLLTELFSDNLDDLTEIYPDSPTDIQLPVAAANSNPALSQASAANSSSSITSLPPPAAKSMITRTSSFSRPPPSISRVPLASIPQNQQLQNPHPGPTEEQQKKVEAIVALGSQMSTTAMACVDVLFSERELANGNTAGTFGFEKLNEEKMRFLSSILRHKFDSPSFMEQWDNVRTKINTKCRGKRRTLVKRLQRQI